MCKLEIINKNLEKAMIDLSVELQRMEFSLEKLNNEFKNLQNQNLNIWRSVAKQIINSRRLIEEIKNES